MIPKVSLLTTVAKVLEGSSGRIKINGDAVRDVVRLNGNEPRKLAELIKKHPGLNADITYQIGDTVSIGGVIKNGEEVIAETSTTLHGAAQERSLIQDLINTFLPRYGSASNKNFHKDLKLPKYPEK